MRGVIDPELGDDVVSLGMVGEVRVDDDGRVTVPLALTIAGCPLRGQLRDDTVRRVSALEGVTGVDVAMGVMDTAQRSAVMERARWKARERELPTDIPGTTRVAAISSGKGGVGKSSVTANLAAALARRGHTVGVLDADIAGFSIPRMLGLTGELGAADGKMLPLERKVGAGLLKVVSMGSIAGTGEDEAVMWRGLMLNRALQHFLEDVRWGDLDYLLLDMPPGTGDVQMGLARMLPRAELLVVTTPAIAAQQVAARAADMARRGFLRVAGVIENMSAFECDHGERYALFGEGGGRRLAAKSGAPLLGSIPLDPSVALGGDRGEPAVLAAAGGSAAAAFDAIAGRLVDDVMPPLSMTGCSARLLADVEARLGPAPA